MRAILLIALLGSSTAALSQQSDSTPAASGQIVVTGERISDLEAALSACIARNCPPNEDVDASLALAEGHFLNGDYDEAEDAIDGSLGRNRRHVRAYPEPVADLYRSQARVQSHRGRDTQALSSTYDILRSLRAGLPQEDHRHFTARFEIVQAEMRRGNLHGARRELRELAGEARQAGRDDVARRARMQELQLEFAAAPWNGAAFSRLRRLAESTDPGQRFERASARFFLARVYRSRGDIERSDAMLAGIPRSDGDRRALLYAPPIRLARAEDMRSVLPGMNSDNFEDTWIDVGYWIEPGGRVSGVEVVRAGANHDWARPVLSSISDRRYEPSADQTPSYRLERYTYTSALGMRTGSRLPMRVGQARVEYLDLTTGDEPGRAPETGVRRNPAS